MRGKNVKAKDVSASALVRRLAGSESDWRDESSEEYDDFSEDEYYYDASKSRVYAPVIKHEDLRSSLQGLKASIEGAKLSLPNDDELTKIEKSVKGVMVISNTVVRVPVYLRQKAAAADASATGKVNFDLPVVVLEFDLSPPYPQAAPGMRVITAADFVHPAEKENLVSWLTVQAGSKKGQQMVLGLVTLASMWAEIQLDLDYDRKEAEKIEREKQKKIEQEAEQARLLEEEADRRAQEAREAFLQREERRKLRAELEEKGEEIDGELYSTESDDSGEQRRIHVPKYSTRFGVPSLRDLCVKVFGDNLLCFEGFDIVPMQIRAKIFHYLIESGSLSHRKLAQLVGSDQKKLDLSKCNYLKDHYLAVLEKTPDLIQLSLAGAKDLTDIGFSKIKLCPRITDLDLSKTQLSSMQFEELVAHCPNLVKVNLSGCPLLTRGLTALAKRCDRLTYLYVNDCEKLLPDDALRCLHSAGPYFHTFELRKCGHSYFYQQRKTGYNAYYGNQYETVSKIFTLDYTPLKRTDLSLVSLNMDECGFISDSFVQKFFVTDLPRLQKFTYKKTPLTSLGLMYLLSRCRALSQFIGKEWSKDAEAHAAEVVYFQRFISSFNAVLREIEIANSNLITLAMLQPLQKVPSLVKLHLSALTHESIEFHSLLGLLIRCKSVKVARVQNIAVEKYDVHKKNALAGIGYSGAEALQLWDLTQLTDEHMLEVIVSFFPSLRDFSLRGRSHVSGASISHLLNTREGISSLTLDSATRVAFPLSLLLDTQHKARLSEIRLHDYPCKDLFTVDTMNNILDERRVPDERIRNVFLSRASSAADQKDFSWGAFFQALFYLCPFMEILDLTHQLSTNQFLRVLELPNNRLQQLRYCVRHDAHVAPSSASCKVVQQDCQPDLVPIKQKRQFGRHYDDDTDDSDDYWDLAGLFD